MYNDSRKKYHLLGDKDGRFLDQTFGGKRVKAADLLTYLEGFKLVKSEKKPWHIHRPL